MSKPVSGDFTKTAAIDTTGATRAAANAWHEQRDPKAEKALRGRFSE